jgi:hypothetical protein
MRDVVFLGNEPFAFSGPINSRVGSPPALAESFQASRALPKSSVPQLEFLRDGLITVDVGVVQVIKQAAALADHHQQAAP